MKILSKMSLNFETIAKRPESKSKLPLSTSSKLLRKLCNKNLGEDEKQTNIYKRKNHKLNVVEDFEQYLKSPVIDIESDVMIYFSSSKHEEVLKQIAYKYLSIPCTTIEAER